MTWLELVALTCASAFTPELPEQISEVAEDYAVERTLVLAVVWKESRCDPQALGPDSDTGLMQVIPRWHGDRMERLGVTSLYDPEQNLRTGTDYLVSLGVRTDPRKALAKYNGGGRPPASSWRYADSVLSLKESLDDRMP